MHVVPDLVMHVQVYCVGAVFSISRFSASSFDGEKIGPTEI